MEKCLIIDLSNVKPEDMDAALLKACGQITEHALSSMTPEQRKILERATP